jgi:hypothetical protein
MEERGAIPTDAVLALKKIKVGDQKSGIVTSFIPDFCSVSTTIESPSFGSFLFFFLFLLFFSSRWHPSVHLALNMVRENLLANTCRIPPRSDSRNQSHAGMMMALSQGDVHVGLFSIRLFAASENSSNISHDVFIALLRECTNIPHCRTCHLTSGAGTSSRSQNSRRLSNGFKC